MAALTGGDKLKAYLEQVAGKVGVDQEGYGVRVGFLEGATYPDGKSVASVMALQEWGGAVTVPAHTTTVYRRTNKAGTHFLRNGRFVKQSQSNFATDHAVPEYTVTIPPRPFFRRMIKAKGPSWPGDIGRLLKANDFDAIKVLMLMGALIKGQLQDSIINFTSPRNAPSTIKRKGFDKPLIDTSHALNSIDFESTGRSREAGSFGGIAST